MAYRLAALLRGSAMGLGDVTIDSARKWREHAVRLLLSQGVPIPKTKQGRRLPEEAYLRATPAMRSFKQSAIEANDIF